MSGEIVTAVFKRLAKGTGDLALMIEQKRIPRQALVDTLALLEAAAADLRPLVEKSSKSSS